MDLPCGPGHHARAAANETEHPLGWATFIPLAFTDGLGWVRITAPQTEARAACLRVTAHIHLMRPEFPLRELDSQAEPAIKALEDGAASTTVIDEFHRVDRAAGA